MRDDVAELVDDVRASRIPELLRLVDDALPVGAEPVPEPDAVEPYRWFLARIGEGVKLTGAGYLPPVVVLETMQTLGWDTHWIGAGNREDLTRPVAELRDSARQLGLVRVQRGVLLRTPAGRRFTDDSAGLWQHIASRLPLGRRDSGRQAGMLWLLATAAGRRDSETVVAQGLTALGWRGADGRGLDAADASAAVQQTRTVFERLGLLPRRSWGEPSAPTPVGVALARAALLGGQPAVDLPPSPRPTGTAAVELTVTLADVEPAVWRRILVPEDMTLWELHAVLQTAMGWHDAHLHLFRVGPVLYGNVEDFPGEPGDEERTTVADAAAVTHEFFYEYDFGDGWEHRIEIGQRLPAVGIGTPHCVAGMRACPPEDCGGPPGYERLLAVLADPSDPEHDELLE
jgi:hypothetical protein